MNQFAEGIWIEIAPARILGMGLTATMTVLRLKDGGLLLHSALPFTHQRRYAIEAIGPVTHIYAPSLYHGMRAGEWAAAFPSARLHAPADLIKEHPTLRIDRVLGTEPEPHFNGLIDELHIDGFRLDETVLIYRPAQTLIVADLVQNIGRPEHWWAKFYTRMMGFYDCVALSRAIRWAGFSDRSAARRSINDLLTRPFDRIIVGHGTPVTSGGRDALAKAYAWLRVSQ